MLHHVAARAQRRTLAETSHRPWPVPDHPWLLAQTWEHLLFAHWRVPESVLRHVVPSQLPLDTYAGSAWIGVTPFLLRGLRARLTPSIPGLSRFPEVNVRTYVMVGGRPGIYFLSLDAASWLAVVGARRTFRLPYFRARMRAHLDDSGVRYSSDRVSSDGEPASFRSLYRPHGESFEATERSLEYFLTERYCLYTLDERMRVWSADIHHSPWRVQLATAEIEHNTMGAPFGIGLADDPLLHFARRQDVLVWPLVPG
jgi:uncharacterized protein